LFLPDDVTVIFLRDNSFQETIDIRDKRSNEIERQIYDIHLQ